MQPPPTRSEIKTHLLGRLEALLDDCDQVADQSKFGHTFNNLEKFFRTKGQNFLQETLELKLQERIDLAESTVEGKQCPECKKKTTSVNRNEDGTQEYRDVKIASAVKRERGDSATPSEWATRELPEPNAVYAVAAIEDRRQIADGRRQQSRRLRRLYPAVCRLPSAVSYWHGAGIGVIEEGIETGGTYAGGFIA